MTLHDEILEQPARLEQLIATHELVELEVLTESPERSKELMETARTELGLDKLEPRTYLEMLIEKTASERNQK